MRIGLITSWCEGGAGHVSKAYERILQQRHEVFIYARGSVADTDDRIWNLPTVTRAPYHPSTTGVHAAHFTGWAKRHGIEAVIFNEQRHWEGVVLARKLGLLVGGYIDYYTADTVPFFDLYHFVICNTRRHFEVFKCHSQPCYCPWGTDTSVYKPGPAQAQRPLTFIISSGLSGAYAKAQPWMDRRGTGMALEAFAKVAGDCRLVVLSQVPLDQCPDEWRRVAERDRRIEFLVGTFNPVPYALGDVYVYPSRLDGIGLTLPEALSSGLPAITTDCQPMNEFVRQGDNGMLVDVMEFRARPDGYYWPESICSLDRLVEAFAFYVDHPDEVTRQGRLARELAERDLCWEKNASFLPDWLETVAKVPFHEQEDFQCLAQKAIKYDMVHNPKPFQSLLVAVKALLYHSWRRFRYQ
ncbi:glycosyltransferase [Geomonas oryzae]|uniref:glycosyltransferase n=1 Tax=Geomonas oryzae TaxID=2364273 RepID=UPI00100A6E5B|nr:glycosyltransferase [Geomonas oryzae]